MIIVKLIGGLGNQMFQYAYAKSVARSTGLPVKLDVSGYYQKDYLALQDDTKRTFLLNKFHTDLPVATAEEVAKLNPTWRKAVRKIKNKLWPINNYQFHPSELRPRDGSYKSGFWQNEKYFKGIADEVRQNFTLSTPLSPAATLMLERIKSCAHPVSVHIRRGDYVTNAAANKTFASLSLEYYKAALEHIARQLNAPFTVFIFSDDIEWTRQMSAQFVPVGTDIVYVSNPATIADYEEIVLMSNCHHHIIANSSFSWWGAWLNPGTEKIVVAPKQWLNDPKVDTSDVVPEGWVRV